MMERKFLITSILATLGAVAFLSGYLLMPGDYTGLTSIVSRGSNDQTGSLIERFNNNIDVKSAEDKVPKTLPLSGRKFFSFVDPFTDSQKIVAVDKDGNIIEIDTATLNEKVIYTGQTNIVEALLSPAGDSVIYSFYDAGNNKKYSYLNFSAPKGRDLASGGRKGESVPIAGGVKSAAFSPRGDQSAYLISRRSSSGNDEGELLISKSGNITKRTLKTRLGAAVVSWPADFISIISYDKDGYGDLFVLKESGELNKILSYQYDLTVKWSPSGEKFLFSTKDDPSYGGQTTTNERLFYKDTKNNKPPAPLDISAGASKCVWGDEEEVICGVKNQAKVRDEFYRVNLTNGIKKLVATPSVNLLTKELALSRRENTLFVLNDIDGKIYALKLKD